MNNPNYQEASKVSNYVQDPDLSISHLQYPDDDIAGRHPVQIWRIDEDNKKFVEQKTISDNIQPRSSTEHKDFSFTNSGLKSLPEYLKYPSKAFELDLSRNYFRFLDSFEWTSKPQHFNTRLVSIDLSNNFLGTVNLSNFKQFQNLKCLNLSLNVLTEINGFENLPQLRRLYLHSNLIRSLWKSISSMKRLDLLSLDWPNTIYNDYDKVLYRKRYLDAHPQLQDGKEKFSLVKLLRIIEKSPNSVYNLDQFQKDFGKGQRQKNLPVELPWAIKHSNIFKIDLILEDNPMLFSQTEYCGIKLKQQKNALIQMDKARELYTILNKSDITKRTASI
jgi:hypothetical protein